MYEYQGFDPTLYLEHYGIKGMRWGVRRTPEQLGRRREYKADKKEYKKLKRETAAATRNLKQRGTMLNEAMGRIKEAETSYNDALSMTTLPWNRKKKYAAIDAASQQLETANKNAERPQANFKRADTIHNEATAALRKKTSEMISKYGDQSVKTLKTKTINLGEDFTKEVTKTGITVANLPFIGNWYTADFVSRKEYDLRERLRDKRAGIYERSHY